jgi:hypothetical protein
MWHILSYSQRTIRTLSLPFNVYADYTTSLWEMRFPHLSSFGLGVWKGDNDEPTPLGENDFMGFILAHGDTIEELDLEYDGYDGDELMLHEDSWPRFRPSSLPHLRSLRGPSSALMTMANSRISSLRTTLSRLAVGPFGMYGMFNAILSPEKGSGPSIGSLLALQEIELDFSQWTDDGDRDDIAEVIQLCARCCPSLQVWRGTFSSCLTLKAEVLGELFGLFGSLRVIYLHEGIILGTDSERVGGESDESEEESEEDTEEESNEDTDGGAGEQIGDQEVVENEDNTADDSKIEAYVGTLALSCQALQEVSVSRTYPRKDWWTINRTWNSTTPADRSTFSLSRRSVEERNLRRWYTSM